MLMIRLTRVGKKNFPTYRVVVQQRQKAPSSNVLEILGHYNPHTNPATVAVKQERLQHWIKNGAQLSDTVHNLFVEHKLLHAEKRKVTHTKKSAESVDEQSAPASVPAENAKPAAQPTTPTPAENAAPAPEVSAEIPSS